MLRLTSGWRESRGQSFDVSYGLDDPHLYQSTLTIRTADDVVQGKPKMAACTRSKTKVPVDCLSKCTISGSQVARHLLKASDLSGRYALPEHTVVCDLTGKTVLSDEVAVSDVTGALVNIRSLKTSKLSGKRAEPRLLINVPLRTLTRLRPSLP